MSINNDGRVVSLGPYLHPALCGRIQWKRMAN